MGRLSDVLGLPADRPPRILAVAPHPDDPEIGAGGTLLRLVAERPNSLVRWLVLSGTAVRAREAEASARALLDGLASPEALAVEIRDHRDGHFPGEWSAVKSSLAAHAGFEPDLVLVPRREDAHQDHRLVAEQAWQVFRSGTILEYEVPKWDGDLALTSLYVPLEADIARRKVEHLLAAFPSQREKDWFSEATFMATLRLRGIECRAPDGLAEGFVCRKLIA